MEQQLAEQINAYRRCGSTCRCFLMLTENSETRDAIWICTIMQVRKLTFSPFHFIQLLSAYTIYCYAIEILVEHDNKHFISFLSNLYCHLTCPFLHTNNVVVTSCILQFHTEIFYADFFIQRNKLLHFPLLCLPTVE